MKVTRSALHLLAGTAALVSTFVPLGSGTAQVWPTRPITMVVPYAARLLLANGTCGWLSGELQAALRDEVAEVAIAGDQRDVVVDAGLGDERIANSGFEALS